MSSTPGDDEAKDDKISRSGHARLRSKQGRPISQIVNDVQRATKGDVFVQPDGRFVVRGPKGREHVIEADGVHVTSLNRPKVAHQQKVAAGERRAATPTEIDTLKRFVN